MNAETSEIVSRFAKLSGRKFVMSGEVRGRLTIAAPGAVSVDEAFNLLSSALALNGYAITKQGDVFVVQTARDAQRSLHEVHTELPPLQPEQMTTLIVQLKYASAEDVNKGLRMFPSKNGEMTPIPRTNQIVFTDYVSNLHRIKKLVDELDKPAISVDAKAKAEADSKKKN